MAHGTNHWHWNGNKTQFPGVNLIVVFTATPHSLFWSDERINTLVSMTLLDTDGFKPQGNDHVQRVFKWSSYTVFATTHSRKNMIFIKKVLILQMSYVTCH